MNSSQEQPVLLCDLQRSISQLQTAQVSIRRRALLALVHATSISSTHLTLRSSNLLEELGESISEIILDFVPDTDETSKLAAIVILCLICNDQGCARELPSGTIEAIVTLYLATLETCTTLKESRKPWTDLLPYLSKLQLNDGTIKFASELQDLIEIHDVVVITMKLLAQHGRTSGRIVAEDGNVIGMFGEHNKASPNFVGIDLNRAYLVRKHLHSQHAWTHMPASITHGTLLLEKLMKTCATNDNSSTTTFMIWRLQHHLKLLEEVTQNDPLANAQCKRTNSVKGKRRRGSTINVQNNVIEQDDTSYNLIPSLWHLTYSVGNMLMTLDANRNASTSYVCLLSTLRILANLTHERTKGCECFGNTKGTSGMSAVHELVQLLNNWFPNVIKTVVEDAEGTTTENTPEVLEIAENMTEVEKRDAQVLNLGNRILGTNVNDTTKALKFDVLVLLLALCTNVLETVAQNRKLVADSQVKSLGNSKVSGCEVLVQMFTKTLPKQAIQKFDNAYKVGDVKKDDEIEFGVSVDQLVISSYIALLLGCLIRNNRDIQRSVLKYLPGNSALTLIQVLETYIAFQQEAGILTKDAMVSITQVMKELLVLVPKAERKAKQVVGQKKNSKGETDAAPQLSSVGYHRSRKVENGSPTSSPARSKRSPSVSKLESNKHAKRKATSLWIEDVVDDKFSNTTEGLSSASKASNKSGKPQRVFRKRVKTKKTLQKKIGQSKAAASSSVFDFDNEEF